MKQFFIVLLVAACSSLSAQVDVSINPIGALFGSPDASGELVLSENFGVQASFGVELGKVTGTALLGDDFAQKKSGYNVRLMAKYYFSPDEGADGFYAGLYTGPRSRKVTSENSDFGFGDYKLSAFTAGLAVGRKWVSSGGITFEAGIGAGRAFGEKFEWSDESGVGEVATFGLDIIGTLSVGYRFGG